MKLPHGSSLETRLSLLKRLQSGDDPQSWQEFYRVYGGLIRFFATKAGLTPDEAEEVVQETAIGAARRLPELVYDPKVCRFKTWLLNLTRWRIIDQIRRRPPHGGATPFPADPARTSTIERLADPAGLALDTVWDQEWEHHLLAAAIQRVKRKVNPEHYQIFHLCAFKDWPVKKVAHELGVSAGQVYLVKHRIAALLKREVKTLEKKMNR